MYFFFTSFFFYEFNGVAYKIAACYISKWQQEKKLSLLLWWWWWLLLFICILFHLEKFNGIILCMKIIQLTWCAFINTFYFVENVRKYNDLAKRNWLQQMTLYGKYFHQFQLIAVLNRNATATAAVVFITMYHRCFSLFKRYRA